MAISRRRAVARASNMPATLLQAMANSPPVNAMSTPKNTLNGIRTAAGNRPDDATAIP